MNEIEEVRSHIIRRRKQLLIHSYLYYRMDSPIVSDEQWQYWADELVKLQASVPGPVGFYDEAFSDWDASTGYHLPQDEYVAGKAMYILKLEEGKNEAIKNRSNAYSS